MNIAIIEYNAGNTQSVIFALHRLGITPTLTDNHEQIAAADKVVFPGVGEAANTMKHLKARGMDKLIPQLKQPVLGICLGMQVMCAHSEEGDTPCLGIFDTTVTKFDPKSSPGQLAKVPHMGWNTLHGLQTPLIGPSLEGRYAYFVHSYYVPLTQNTIAKTEYLTTFSAAMQKNNFYAVQFHPEKSASTGADILQNFVAL